MLQYFACACVNYFTDCVANGNQKLYIYIHLSVVSLRIPAQLHHKSLWLSALRLPLYGVLAAHTDIKHSVYLTAYTRAHLATIVLLDSALSTWPLEQKDPDNK